MIVLWITNITFPEAVSLLSGNNIPSSSGSWMIGAAKALVQQPNVTLVVASVSMRVRELTRIKGNKILYYLLPYGKGNIRVNHDYESFWRVVNNEVHPDIVHIHGTEFSHGLAYIDACGAEHVCISIQGLLSACYLYYCQGLSRSEILNSLTPASLLTGGIISAQRNFKRRIKYEKEMICRVSHIIGRTCWDRSQVWAINARANYYHCGETLRTVFYEKPSWKYNQCIPHCIFISQAGYPLKGLHMVLRAMPLVLRSYPDATIRVAGANIIRSSSFIERLRLGNYGNLIRKMIKKDHLENCVSFLGPLGEREMREEYLSCNLFICPSSIENSPNSLGEAQLLGVPVLASFVGGVPDMMCGDEQHLYRYEDVEVLANKICEIFEMKEMVSTSDMQLNALKRHDPVSNANGLVEIYKKIISC